MSTKHRTTLPDPAMIEPAILAKLHTPTLTDKWVAALTEHMAVMERTIIAKPGESFEEYDQRRQREMEARS